MYDLIVIGAGPAGLAAACAAWDAGLRRILVVERAKDRGGILNQCIHNGFGLHRFHEELTGPEYAQRFIDRMDKTGIERRCDTMVLSVGRDRSVEMVGAACGYAVERAKSVILATGCRERTRGAISIPGTRPAGVLTAGAAQRYVNIDGCLPGRRVVILGSGDIGLIMARRMTLEGARVLACVEVMPYSGGLTRNIVQCLHDFDIPLYLSHTVTDIRGKSRVEQVVVSRVDENRRPIPGTEMTFDCDTLLLSVGLIPENELANAAGIELDPRTNGAVVYENMETSIPGVFACGNAAHVHDLVDYVSEEAERAGAAAAEFVQSGARDADSIELCAGDGLGYVLPQRVRPACAKDGCTAFFRVRKCYGKSRIVLSCDGEVQRAIRKPRLAPGEMERIEIPAELLRAAKQRITIAAEEDEI